MIRTKSHLATSITAPVWRFVPRDLDADSLDALEPLFESLAHRPLSDADAIERWLLDESELQARIGAALARRYVRMTRATDDSEAREAYLAMEQKVMPRVRILGDASEPVRLAVARLIPLLAGWPVPRSWWT